MTETGSRYCRHLAALLSRLGRSDDASVSMEYGLVATLISVAIIASLTGTTDGLASRWISMSATVVNFLR